MRVLLFHWRRRNHALDSSPRAGDSMPIVVSAWLARCRQRLGDRLFTIDDARARVHGWQITPIEGGLGRRYRERRFDSLATCQACNGHGGRQDALCQPCLGSGRVIVQHPHQEG